MNRNLPLSIEDARELHKDVQDPTHDFSHVLRVFRMAEKIGEIEGADMRVLLTACLLHDIERPSQEAGRGNSHAQEGAERAREILAGEPVEFVDAVCGAIASHSVEPVDSLQPQTLEAKILFDADKLDYSGAIGIARVFAYGGYRGLPLWKSPDPDERTCFEDFHKLLRVRDLMYTRAAREIAEEHHAIAAQFFDRMNYEVEGKK